MPVHSVVLGHNDRCGAHAVDIAPVDVQLDENIVTPFVVHKGRRVVARHQRFMEGGQFLNFGDKFVGQIFRFCPGRTQTGGNTFTCEAYLILGEWMVIGWFETRYGRFHPDRIDACQFGGGVDPTFFPFGNFNSE